MGLITQQPNGKYARISYVVDAPTHWNWTEAELGEYLHETNQYDFEGQTVCDWMERWGKDFETAKNHITDINLTKQEIEDWLKEVAE